MRRDGLFRILLDAVGSNRNRYAIGRAILSGRSAIELDAAVRAARVSRPLTDFFPDWACFLDDWNQHPLALGWYRDAFEAGVDPYLATAIVTRIWQTQSPAAAALECDRLAELLERIAFDAPHGDEFHKGMVRRILTGLKNVIAFEQGSGVSPADVASELHDAVRGVVWPRLWQLARIKGVNQIRQMAQLYPHVYRCDVQQSLFAIEYFLAPYEYWAEASTVLDEAAVTPETDSLLAAQLLRWRVEVSLMLGKPADARAALHELMQQAVVPAGDGTARIELAAMAARALWAQYRHLTGRQDEEMLALRLSATRLLSLCPPPIPGGAAGASSSLTLLLGHIAEDLGERAAAENHYRAGATFDPGSYLPHEFWRAASFLAGENRWDVATAIQCKGVLTLWPDYEALATVPPAERYASGRILPDRAVMLNCDGIGDDLWRIIMLLRLKGYDCPYAFVVDDRLQAPLSRALPHREFLTRSRTTGSHAVSVETFHRDRIGVPAWTDVTRLTGAIVAKIHEYGEVCLSEDVFSEYFRRAGNFEFAYDHPVLAADPNLLARAHAWLATLPSGHLNIGLSWRTAGLGNLVRRLNHYLVDELGALLRLPGVNWIVLQYTVTPEEIALAEALFGARLHEMPGVDLRDDIDQIVAIGLSLDLMLATPSTIEPLVAATGTPVISLAAGYDSVAQYRIGPDGEANRMLPSIRHISAKRYGSKDAIVREAARRIEDIVRQR